MKYLPLSPKLWDGKASKNRDKSEDLPDKADIQSFREEKRRIID